LVEREVACVRNVQKSGWTVLGHSAQTVIGIHYNHALRVEEVRQALDWWSDELRRIVGAPIEVTGFDEVRQALERWGTDVKQGGRRGRQRPTQRHSYSLGGGNTTDDRR
jgi:hypothetical protein